MQGWERCTPAQSRCSARPSLSGIPDPGQRRLQCRNPVKQSAAVLDILNELFKGVAVIEIALLNQVVLICVVGDLVAD